MSNESFNSTFQDDFTESFKLSKFEIKTLTYFCLTKDFKDDSVSCISSPSYIVIVSATDLYVYKEETQEIYWKYSFNSECEYVDLSDDLCLLLIVEKPGSINLIHLPSSKLIWSYECGENGSKYSVQNVVFSTVLSGFLSIFAFTWEGILFEFTKIETLSLYQAVEEDTVSKFFNNIFVKKINLSTMFPDFSIKSIFQTFSPVCSPGIVGETKVNDFIDGDYYTIEEMVDGDFTCDWEFNNEEDKFFIFDTSGYGKMIKTSCTRDGRYIVCLNQENMLLIFSTITHFNLADWGNKDIQDFALYDTIDPSTLSISDSKIGILCKNKNGLMFEIRKFPSFEFIHKIQLSEFVQLVNSKPNQDVWYLVEKTPSPDDPTRTNLDITSISQSRPEARLLSLLNRRKFKEAEKYAKMCNLNDEIIFKTKISCMLKDSVTESFKISKSEQECIWHEVESSLNKIKDIDFIKSCLAHLEPEMEVMRKFLSCINSWLAVNNIEGAEHLICEINRNENKLLTYNGLPESTQSFLSLKEFLKKDLRQFMVNELTEGCLNAAFIIWQSHKDEILRALTLEQIQEILNSIPDDIPSPHLISFLEEDFLPFVLIKLPEALDIIADWIISRIHLLELTEKESWPENGYQLASMFLELIQKLQEKMGKGAISYTISISLAYVHKKMMNKDSRTGCLFELSKTLNLLVNLKKTLNCKISLTSFQDFKQDVIFAILDRVSLKLIAEAINEFARPYTLENNMDLDLSLESYIKDTLQTSHFTWWSWDEAPWEERLTAVLECIIDSERWTKAALMLISHATVPWSERIKNIVALGLNSDNASKEQYKKQSKQVDLKEILVKYNFRSFPMVENLQLIHTLVNYILKQNRGSALEDAKRVILAYYDALTTECYISFLQFYLNQNKLDELASILGSIPTTSAIECCFSLLSYISLYLEDNFLVANNWDRVKIYLSAGLYLFEFLKSQKQPVDLDLLHGFQCLKKLQKEFDIHVTISDVMSKENAIKIVETYIHSVLNEEAFIEKGVQQNKKQTTLSLGIFRIKRLGCILDLEIENVMAILITNCLERKMYNLVIKLCGELISSYPVSSSSETLIQVVNHFSENFQNIRNISFETIIATVCHLSNLAVTHCQSSDIGKCIYAVRLSTYLAFLNKITCQQTSFMLSNTGIYHKWRFSSVYEDDGFQLDLTQVADFILKLLPLFLRCSKNLEGAVDFPMVEIFNVVFRPIISHMKEKGQEIAVLRTMYQFYHLQMEFLQNDASTQEAFSLITNYVKDSIINLLRRLIDKKKLDMELSIGLLSIFLNEQSFILSKLKRWSAKDLSCIMSLGEIGSECCRVFANPEYREYEVMYRRAFLLLKQNIKITQTDIALNTSDSDFNWGIAKEIILCPKTNLTTIFEFSSAFDFVTDHVLIAFLNNLLFESEKLCFANIDIPEDSLKVLLNRTKCAIEAVNSEELIVKNFESLLKKISSYSYEVLQFIHEQLLHASANILTITSTEFEKTIALLNFLRVYERVSSPGETELEQWLSLHPTDAKLPVIANRRLPFLSIFEDIYKIINPELTATTLNVWLTVSPLLNLQKHHLVLIAVKNAVTTYLDKLPKKILVLNQDNSFLHNIYKMIQNISHPEVSVDCSIWVANKMPPGANKVCSCMIAVKFAEKWHEVQPNERKSLDVLKKSKERYQRSAIERILYQNNLANDLSLSYLQNPLQLVEYFTEEFCFSAESSLKICKVAVEIAKIVDINIDEIFEKNLLKWLYTSQTSNNLDETFGFNDSKENVEIEDDSTEDRNLFKAINLLLGVSSINHDICASLKENSRTMTVIQRSRLLFCMVAVYGFARVAEDLQMSSEQLQESLPLVLCTAELEHLHLRYSREMVPGCNLELVHSVLANQNNNPRILLCCVKMCLENKIWSPHIWDIILQRLVMLSMAESLQDILHTAQGHLTHMWHNKSFISAWNYVISNCYKNEFMDASKIIEKVYKTVLCCPCVSALDIESIWSDLKYILKSSKEQDLRKMEPICDASSFIQALKTLREACLFSED